MEWGDKVEFLENAVAPDLLAQGKTVKALAARPAIDGESSFYLDAFAVLSRGRQSGMGGPGGIAFADIEAYSRRLEIHSPTSFERFLRVILAMDDAYLTRIAKDMPKPGDSGK